MAVSVFPVFQREVTLFARFSHAVSVLAGKPITFALAVGFIVAWGITGPIFAYSETWQLVVNTATSISTFLMVFVLQNSQNRDGAALQAKLDELIYAVQGADNAFVEAEKLTDADLKILHDRLVARCATASQELERRDIDTRTRRVPEQA